MSDPVPLDGDAGVVGVGTDLVDTGRIRAALARTEGLRDRLFTSAEWEYAHRHRDPVPHLAARFAAKEAVMKALGHGMEHLSFHEVEVVRDDDGRPGVRLHGRAAAVAESVGVRGWRLSMSHTDALGHAVVVALGPGAPR